MIVLVPVNWAVSGLGRVEWAWAAAPVIAIGLHRHGHSFGPTRHRLRPRRRPRWRWPSYRPTIPAGTVARYNALYTSLTTYYNLQSDDPGAAILPFPTRRSRTSSACRRPANLELTCRRGDQVAFATGFHVGSNSTGLVHSEELLDFGGGISLVKDGDRAWKLINRTELELARRRAVAEDPLRRRSGLARRRPPEGWALQCPVTCPVKSPYTGTHSAIRPILPNPSRAARRKARR